MGDKFTHGSLFSGIGGFDLAAEWAGWENMFHCEWNEFGQKILKYYWPYAKSYQDITKTDFSIWRGRIDVLTGGFPCQPYSVAGKRKGKKDERHLWPEMLRAIREIKPSWVVGENVHGLVNWNDGLVFNEVQADLENEGYQVQSYILPACGVNAPHRRDRVWFIAYSDNDGHGRRSEFGQPGRKEGQSAQLKKKRERVRQNIGRNGTTATTSNSKSNGLERNRITWNRRFRFTHNNSQVSPNSLCFGFRNKIYRNGTPRLFDKKSQANDWENFPTESPVCFGNDGLSGKLDGITFPKWRKESLKGGGNAVVPQLVLQIFETINLYLQRK